MGVAIAPALSGSLCARPVVKTFGQTIFSFKRFKAAIDNYEKWVIAYTKALRLPMMFYTTAINGVFAFLIADITYINIPYQYAPFLRIKKPCDNIGKGSLTAARRTNQRYYLPRSDFQWYIVLSGGEQQRIAIARAILKNAPILILDEATAFADPDNEVRVQQALSVLSKGKTVIMIAHRLSSITEADCIYVLQDGKIVAIRLPDTSPFMVSITK